MAVLSEQFQITAPGPDAVQGTSAQIVGPPGLATYYYWWVSHYPIGVTVLSAPVIVRGAPSTLNISNYVTVSGQPALGATIYDLLRTTSAQLPSGTATIAVATGLTTPTFNDQGAALTAYNVAGLSSGAPVSEYIFLNNRDFAKPTLVISPFGLAVPGVTLTAGGVTFPDGSTQTTAGQTPITVPIWRTYTVTLVGTNWQITASDGTVTTVPTAAATTQDIPLATVPANAFFTFIRFIVPTAGPCSGTTAAKVQSAGFIGNDAFLAFINLSLQTAPSNTTGFQDINTTPGNVTVNTPETLTVTVLTTGGNVNNIIGPCAFSVSVLWAVTP